LGGVPLIIDAFLANDEQELVQLRISYLSPTVDTVFIGEAVETFSGKNKEMTFKPLSDGKKIFHIQIPKAPSNIEPSDRWNREEFQRDYFLNQIQRFTSPEDIVFSATLMKYLLEIKSVRSRSSFLVTRQILLI
jgi:hypothetical protein